MVTPSNLGHKIHTLLIDGFKTCSVLAPRHTILMDTRFETTKSVIQHQALS